MFYVKIKYPNNREIMKELTKNNVFTKCKACKKEFAVDVGKVFNEVGFDIEKTEILCPECADMWKLFQGRKSHHSSEQPE